MSAGDYGWGYMSTIEQVAGIYAITKELSKFAFYLAGAIFFATHIL